jgi:hypothetical protein
MGVRHIRRDTAGAVTADPRSAAVCGSELLGPPRKLLGSLCKPLGSLCEPLGSLCELLGSLCELLGNILLPLGNILLPLGTILLLRGTLFLLRGTIFSLRGTIFSLRGTLFLLRGTLFLLRGWLSELRGTLFGCGGPLFPGGCATRAFLALFHVRRGPRGPVGASRATVRDVGLFDRLFGKKSSASASEAPAPEPEPDPPPDGVLVLRQGMSVPDSAYVLAVAQTMLGDRMRPELPHAGMAQPVWFRAGEFTRSGVADAAMAYAVKFGLGVCSHRHTEAQGPDGARVMLIELWREGA